MEAKETKIGALRVWHIPQVPGKPFHIYVNTPKEAQQVLQLLDNYDQFQFENNIKPDFSSSSGLEQFMNSSTGTPEWTEWYDEETDDDISERIGPDTTS